MLGSRSLIGRDAELAALVEAVDGDRATVLVGEAGIGKTALARAAVAAAGRTIHEGGGFATLHDLPYLALRRAVDAQLAGDPVSVAAAIERRIGPDVLFVDDAQWADEQTLATVELLVGRILVIAAVRSLDPGSEHAIEMFRRARADIRQVAPLAGPDSRALIAERRPDLPDRVVDDILRRAAGNPLLLEEMAIQGDAPDVLARVMTARLEQLSRPARTAVELLAVAERPLPRAALGRVIDVAISVGIIVERDAFVDLRHQLVADAVRDGLDPETRRRHHARIAAILGPVPEAARHLAAAGRPAAARAIAHRGLSETTDPRERAALLVIAAESGKPGQGAGLRLEAARALDEVSDWSGVVRVLGGVAGEGAPEETAEAQALLAHAAYELGDVEAARRYVIGMDGPSVAPTSRAAVRCAIEAATFLVNVDGAVEPAIRRLDAAAQRLGPDDPAARDVTVLRSMILQLAAGAGDPDAIRRAADEAFDAGRYRTATDRARVIQFVLNLAVGSEEALAFLLERQDRYAQAGIASMATEFLADSVVAALVTGRFDLAIATADRLLEAPAPIRSRQTAEIYRARAMAHLGRLDEAEQALAGVRRFVSSDFFGLGDTLQGQAEVAFWGGLPQVALEHAEAALTVAAPIPVAHTHPMVTRAWARSELGLDPGQRPPYPLPPSVAGAGLEIEGLTLDHAGAHGEAAARFEQAAMAWSRFHVPRWVECRWAAGEQLRRAGDPRAVEVLRAALDAATTIRFEPLAARVRRSLRLAGVRVPPSRGAVGSSTVLTARELELVALVEGGLTNVEIARRLGLGRPTVARILASAMTKLGVGSRTQLAAHGPT